MSLISNKKDFFESSKLETELVEIGDGKSVLVTELNGPDFGDLWTDERFEVEDGGVDVGKMLPILIARTVIDDKGNRIFTDKDAPKIEVMKARIYLKLATVARNLNGIGVIKNSGAGLEEGSPSDSQKS